jgi:hypothetical protein
MEIQEETIDGVKYYCVYKNGIRLYLGKDIDDASQFIDSWNGE